MIEVDNDCYPLLFTHCVHYTLNLFTYLNPNLNKFMLLLINN